MASLYTDENFRYPVVVQLRLRGHDVLTAHQAGNAGRGIGDPEVLAYAVSSGRAVVTYNRRHFIRLHMLDPSHAGIVICRDDPDVVAQAARIDHAIAAAGPLAGQLIRVIRPPRPPAPPPLKP
jgi:Domain of unknown function (DUF5615)